MAPTSKLLKMLVKDNILKSSRAPQKPDRGIHFPPLALTFKIAEAESQRSPSHPMLVLPSCHKEELALL